MGNYAAGLMFATIGLVIATVPSIAFVIIYMNELRYIKSTQATRHLIGFTTVLAVFFLEVLVRRLYPDLIPLDFHIIFVAIMFTLVGAYLWQRLYMLLRHQVIPRRRGEFCPNTEPQADEKENRNV